MPVENVKNDKKPQKTSMLLKYCAYVHSKHF